MWLERHGRGAAALLCRKTSLSEPEVANWLAGRRELSANKLVEAISWLLSTDHATITLTGYGITDEQ